MISSKTTHNGEQMFKRYLSMLGRDKLLKLKPNLFASSFVFMQYVKQADYLSVLERFACYFLYNSFL